MPMATPKNRLPDCGLDRATKALPGHEERVPAGSLVYFHNHSESGPLPSVLAPDHNVHNRWHFHGPPIEFRGLSWAESLEHVNPEGFYTLRKELLATIRAVNAGLRRIPADIATEIAEYAGAEALTAAHDLRHVEDFVGVIGILRRNSSGQQADSRRGNEARKIMGEFHR